MKLAMVFPGQGSQSVGMMAGYDEHPVVRATFDLASEVLGQDLWQLASSGPAEAMNLTVNTQPLMLTADVAVYRAWRAAGGRAPQLVAGHSLGEYAALVAAGALGLEDALPLVRFRAQAMQDAVPEGTGAMAAVLGADEAAIDQACRQAVASGPPGEVVEAVNFNAPGQIVVAGHRAAVERVIVAAKVLGARRALMLPVSAPFHSSLLKPAADRLAAYLANVPLAEPSITVLHNVDVAPAHTPQAIRAALARQAARPVRWQQTMQAFVDAGVTHIVECGPGRVLTGLVRKLPGPLATLSLDDGVMIASALESTQSA